MDGLALLVNVLVHGFALYCLYKIAINRNLSSRYRVFWFLLVLVQPLLGALAYTLIGAKQRRKEFKLLGRTISDNNF
ncbi:PLDc N-terminal domain-containing protein [Sphingobacterium sp. FBM7-1]|uniref:PLDc N-terminal domain-containing protein n=1 Tax=Sphingobacterium sp. FBM7-1 TaxID=2886688 RepID=UPI001D0F6FB1|nr:PLDc N-terminal domain-containing protein [Sphingobacterium sp. FBM7-1]